MSATVAPRLDVTVTEARKLVGAGLAGAVGLAKGRWIVVGITLAIVTFAIALLVREKDPVLEKLDAAPDDDELITDEERKAIEAARAEVGIPWEEAKKELVTAGREGKTTL